eukprot:5196737-Heterocapsa_arctica.AAC.1
MRRCCRARGAESEGVLRVRLGPGIDDGLLQGDELVLRRLVLHSVGVPAVRLGCARGRVCLRAAVQGVAVRRRSVARRSPCRLLCRTLHPLCRLPVIFRGAARDVVGLHRRGRDRNAFSRVGDRRAGRSRGRFFLRRDGDGRIERLAILVLEDLACGVEECGLVVLRCLAVGG